MDNPFALIKSLLRSPIAFHRVFADIAGGACNGLFLSQLWYWSQRTDDPEGWIYKTQEEWTDETSLSRREQETARKALLSQGLLKEDRRGLPARLYYRLCTDTLQTRLYETSNQACTKAPNKKQQNVQSFHTETTTEITTETTLSPKAPKGARTRQAAFSLDYSPGFLEFWDAYHPQRRKAKPLCFAEWQRLHLEPRAPIIVAEIARLMHGEWLRLEPKYVPLSRTWLHQGRWEDSDQGPPSPLQDKLGTLAPHERATLLNSATLYQELFPDAHHTRQLPTLQPDVEPDGDLILRRTEYGAPEGLLDAPEGSDGD